MCSMKFVGRADGAQAIICRLFDDGTVADVAEATEFYIDLPASTSAAAELATGTQPRAEIVEVPAVRPSARVLCVGLNYRLPAAEAGLPIPDYPAFFGRWTSSVVAGATRFRCHMGSPAWIGRWNSRRRRPAIAPGRRGHRTGRRL
jgi:2,4-didehydro-3-deoxy-L-rhamnonate hydrolase